MSYFNSSCALVDAPRALRPPAPPTDPLIWRRQLASAVQRPTQRGSIKQEASYSALESLAASANAFSSSFVIFEPRLETCSSDVWTIKCSRSLDLAGAWVAHGRLPRSQASIPELIRSTVAAGAPETRALVRAIAASC